MNYTPKPHNGKWAVFCEQGIFRADLSNAQAWRIADKMNGEALSKQEDTAAWASRPD